jgi:hypothetical protein
MKNRKIMLQVEHHLSHKGDLRSLLASLPGVNEGLEIDEEAEGMGIESPNCRAIMYLGTPLIRRTAFVIVATTTF